MAPGNRGKSTRVARIKEKDTYSHITSISVLEVENRSPVVRLVFLEATSGTGGGLGVVLVGVHRHVEAA